MRYVRPAFVVFVLLVLQTALFADLDIFGAKAEVVLLLPIAAGIAGGADRGALVGFIAGISLDLVVHGTPTGFFALGYTLTGYIVGMTQAAVLRAAWWIPVLIAFAGTVLGIVVLTLIGKFIGIQVQFNRDLVTICLVAAITNAILITPMMRVVRWALPVTSRSGRVLAV